MVFRLISLILSLSLFCQQAGVAYASGELNLANYLSSMRNAVVQPDIFQPPRLRYISYDINNNDFKLLLDKGNIVGNGLEPFPTQQEEAKLFNYFLIGLALPNDTFWVNLRPDAPENIIDPLLEKTDIGKIFLEADLQLKKDTASLTSPQNPEGKSYWDKLYKKAGELFGTENITIPTITRPWIVPNEVIVRETEDSAYIYKATLKVMLEADYLIGRGGSRTAPTPEQYAFSDPRLKELNEYSSQIIRETIIPRLTREVNSSKRYAQLRQVYYSLVLARWFKQKYSSLGSARAPEHQGIRVSEYISLIDSGNLANLISREPCDKQTYFQAYQKSFKDGEYNLKETVASPYGQSIRNYISGGINTRMYLNKVYVGVNSEKVTDVLKNGGMSSGSPLTVEDIRKVKVKLNKYAKIVSNFYEGLSSVDLTNWAEQKSFSEDYKNYSRDFIGAIELKELIDAVSIALKLTRDKKPFGYTLAKWQKILVDLAWIKKRIDLALEENMAKLIELFGDKELHKYFPGVEKSRLAYYNQKYGQPGELKNIATAIDAANIAAALYKGNNIDVREKWEMVAAVLGEIDSVSGQWLGNMRKVRGSLFALKLSIEKWSEELSDDTRNKWLSNIRQEMENVLLPGLTNIQEDISKYDPVKSVLAIIDEYVKELEEGKISSQAALNAFVEQRVIVYMLVNIDLYLARYQRYGGIKGLKKRDTDKLNEILKAFRDEMMGVAKVSSALIQGGQESDVLLGKTKIDFPGGIDFTDRAMRLKIKRVGSFADLKLVLPRVQNVQGLDLDKEFRQIEAIASSGIVPNSRRILELFSACYSLGEFGRRLPQVISALKSSSAIQESLAIDSDDDFRMCLLLPEVFSDGR